MNAAPPALPRNVRARRKMQSSEPHQFGSPNEKYKVDYFSVVDSTIDCLEKCTLDKALLALNAIENLIISGWHGLPVAEACKVGSCVQAVRIWHWCWQTKGTTAVIGKFSKISGEDKSADVGDLLSIIGKSELAVMVPQVVILAKLYLVNPATTATFERSFSRLRRLKSYLRSTMTQSCLNHLFLMNMYQDIVDSLDMKTLSTSSSIVEMKNTEIHLTFYRNE